MDTGSGNLSNVFRFLIYGLFDPRDGALRYVGKSCSGLRRPGEHKKPSVLRRSCTHKANWIRQLQALGLQYEVEVLEEHERAEDLAAAERFYIAYFRFLGCDLTNGTSGGDGQTKGYCPSEASRLKVSASLRGRRLSIEARMRIRESSASRRGARRSRPVVDENGVRYGSIRAAARALGLNAGNVGAVLSGRYAHSGGHVFRYLEAA